MIVPDILADPSITLSNAVQLLFRRVASAFTQKQRLLLCCVRWNFSAHESTGPKWAFHNHVFGGIDDKYEPLKTAVQWYHGETGESITAEEALKDFNSLVACTKILSI